MPLAVCHTRCWDGRIYRHYYPGDQDDIPIDDPFAKHFTFIEDGAKNEPVQRDFRPTPTDFMMKDPAIEAVHSSKRPLPIGAQRAIDAAARQRAKKEQAEVQEVKEE